MSNPFPFQVTVTYPDGRVRTYLHRTWEGCATFLRAIGEKPGRGLQVGRTVV